MKNIFKIFLLLLVNINICNAQSTSMFITCPGTVTDGSDFMVEGNYTYSNIIGDSITVTLSFNDAEVMYIPNSVAIYTPVLSGSAGGICTLTYRIPISTAGFGIPERVRVFFKFRVCPLNCYGMPNNTTFNGSITTPTLTTLAATPCNSQLTPTNTWVANHSIQSYDCRNNKATFRIDLSNGKCFSILNPKIKITTNIPGVILSSFYGTITGNTINVNRSFTNGASIYYTIELPCVIANPTSIISTATLTGDNCGTAVPNIVPIPNAIYNAIPYKEIYANLNHSINNNSYIVYLSNYGSVPLNALLKTKIPNVKINSVNISYSSALGTAPTASMTIYDCSSSVISTSINVFPQMITSPPFIKKSEYSISGLNPGQTATITFTYDRTNSCTGLPDSTCLNFCTKGSFDGNLTTCNCIVNPIDTFAEICTQICIPPPPPIYVKSPQIYCIGGTYYYLNAPCFQKEATIPFCFNFKNYGDTFLVNAKFNIPLPASMSNITNITLNGSPVTGTLTGSTFTIPIPNVNYGGATYSLCFDGVISSTPAFGTNYFSPYLTGENPAKIAPNNACYFQQCQGNYKICELASASIEKKVKGSEDLNFTTNGNGMAGSIATYEYTIKNNGNIAITDIEIVDRLPEVGDKFISSCLPRNSQYTMLPIANPMIPVALNTSLLYTISSTGSNTVPINWMFLLSGSCNNSGSYTTPIENTTKVTLPNSILPYTSYTFYMQARVNPTAKSGDNACNSAAFKCYTQNWDGTKSLLGGIAESNLACISVMPPPCGNCNDLLTKSSFVLYHGTTTSGSKPYVLKLGKVTIKIVKPVQEIKLSLADLSYHWDKAGCVNCKSPSLSKGCLFPQSALQRIGSGGTSGSLIWDDFTGNSVPPATPDNECPKELIWKLGVMLQPGTYEIPFQISLPKSIIEDCCELIIENLNIHVSIKDKDCKVCDSNIISSNQDCCTGSSWVKKQMTWDLFTHDDWVETGSMQKLSSKNVKSDNKSKQFEKIVALNNLHKDMFIDGGQLDYIPLYGTTKIRCDMTDTILEGSERMFSGTYICNTSMRDCQSEVLITIKTLSGDFISVNNKPSGFNQSFNLPGVYEITYTAMCGGKVCNECKFTLVVKKNCCTGLKKIKPTTVTTEKFFWPYSTTKIDTIKNAFPIPTYTGFGGAIVNINYQCAIGCTPIYEWTKKRNGLVISSGNSSSSIINFATLDNGKDLIQITVKCGTQNCFTNEQFYLGCDYCTIVNPTIERKNEIELAK